MSRKTRFGDDCEENQRNLCLKYAEELSQKTRSQNTPTEITNYCIERELFPDAQLEAFRFEGARRQVERWLKTRDETGLELWGQIPFTDEDGEMFWEPRKRMNITAYAWNYLRRDDMAERNAIRRDRWKEEAASRWGERTFMKEVERLRTERDRKAG